MATFAKSTFDAASYAACRPTYPRSLFELIFKYHQEGSAALPIRTTSTSSFPKGRPRFNTAVDLGCGTGQATAELTPFKRIIGVDPSKAMVEKARVIASESLGSTGNASQFEFVQSPAEELGFIKDGSVDLVIAAQAAHWFDWHKLWPELGRVLSPNGTVAFWCYSELRLPQYQSLTPAITDFAQGTDPQTSLGPHFQRPGRTILEKHLVDVPSPLDVPSAKESFAEVHRLFYAGSYYPDLPKEQTLPVILRSKITWNWLLGYFHTFSPLYTYLELHPEDAKREDGNIAQRFWKSLMKEAEKEAGKAVKPEDELMIEWPVALVLAKKVGP